MEFMKPMKPMKGIEPMEPMKAMDSPASDWWPTGLSDPSASGAAGGWRYAFFPKQRRLAVEHNGRVSQYDTGAHQINGVSQQQQHSNSSGAPKFSSQNGEVDFGALRKVN